MKDIDLNKFQFKKVLTSNVPNFVWDKKNKEIRLDLNEHVETKAYLVDNDNGTKILKVDAFLKEDYKNSDYEVVSVETFIYDTFEQFYDLYKDNIVVFYLNENGGIFHEFQNMHDVKKQKIRVFIDKEGI